MSEKLSLEIIDGRTFLYDREKNHPLCELVDVQEQDARRLAAAWNLCDGTATELIENAPSLGRLIAERGELLSACKNVASLLMKLGGKNHDPEYSELVDIIAKAEGKS